MKSSIDELNEIYIISFSAIALFAFLVGFIVYFVLLYQKKQIQHRLDQENLRSTFKQELLKTQIEVQEQTLADISRELHDNISQVLSFTKLTLAFSPTLAETEKQRRIAESREVLSQAITDLRDLSKSISFEHIATLGLVKTLQNETERINKSKLINVSLNVDGFVVDLGEQCELVLFRIFQETLNNTLKHAQAKQLKINLQYSDDLFKFTLEDNGIGFYTPELLEKEGSGLRNIKNRAALVGAEAVISSKPGQGCCITITLNPFKRQLYQDGNNPNSIG
jgi:signal transduction histidine kinase